MKRTNSIFVVARLMLIVLTLAITVFSFASCEGLPPELQGLLGGKPDASCEHVYDNARDTDCNICGATRTVEPDNTRYTITEEEWNATLKLRNFTYIQTTPAPGVEYKITETAIHISNGSKNMYAILKDGITYGSEDGVNWKAYDDNFDSLSERYALEHMIGHYGVTFAKFLEAYEYSEESKSYVRTLAKGGTAEFSFADGKLVSFISNGQTPIQITNVGTTVVEYSEFNVEENKPACEHANVENCVCKDCGEPVHGETMCVVTPTASNCGQPGYRCDVYMCNNCERVFYDEACKSEITDVNSVIMPPLGHKIVGGICEICGASTGGTIVEPGVPTPFDSACKQLRSLYTPDDRKATPSDYELVSKIVVDGEVFIVTWTIANESITLTYDADKDVYIVNVPDEVSKNCYYSIVASITNNTNGHTNNYTFVRLLESTESTDGDSTVCQHKNANYVKAALDTSCDDYKIFFDIYVCCDCVKIFYDAECKNEVPLTTPVTVVPSGHRYVTGSGSDRLCEKCGAYDSEGVFRPVSPTLLGQACAYLSDMYKPDHKKATTSDYELISKVVIDGKELAVTWTVSNESITITYDANKDVYVVNIPDEVSEVCYYFIVATISDGEGESTATEFVRVLVPSEA